MSRVPPALTHRRSLTVIIVVLMIALGAAVRLLPGGLRLPWVTQMPITLYFSDGQYLVPVSSDWSDASPRRVVEALLADPPADMRLTRAIPAGTKLLDFTLDSGIARLNLSSEFLQSGNQAADALRWSLLALTDVDRVELRVEGSPLSTRATAEPVFLSNDRYLVAVPVNVDSPRAALEVSFAGDAGLITLPTDVHLLSYNFSPSNGLVTLDFNYTASLRQLATDRPETMRQILIGLVATLTRFPQVTAVTLDFDGHTQLGLGQCANLLRAPQLMPSVLNDPRSFTG